MSFASEVKKELINLSVIPCCKHSVVCGILQGCAEIVLSSNGPRVQIKSHVMGLMKLLLPYFKQNYQTKPDVGYSKELDLNHNRIYGITITENAQKIIDDFHLLPLDSLVIDDFDNICCQRSFVRGLFIAKGSINNPHTSHYHLEISCRKKENALLAQKFLSESDIETKITSRNDNYILYIKKAEKISDFLAFVGASSGVYYYEDSRIQRDLNNSLNRMVNCDMANLKRTVKASQKILEMIKYLEDNNHINRLSQRLQDAITLRKYDPEFSYSQLSDISSEVIGKPLSKSAISHCLREIEAYYHQVNKDTFSKTTEDK